MGLKEYRRKRNFGRTPEPSGRERPAAPGRQYVIQKHAASRLHYDLRLEDGGVLKSWAIPKGPSLDPKNKRLAVEVEDHPIEYGAFEGVIPKGQYGGGTVLLWDRGTWTPKEDPVSGFRKGVLKFDLNGTKLRGGWTLVRLKDRTGDGKPNWLLIKENDQEARSSNGGPDILDQRPESAASRRQMDEIARQADRTWQSDRTSASSSAPPRTFARTAPVSPSDIPGARKAALPPRILPQLATLKESPPQGDAWLHEMKLDGYRILCRISGGAGQGTDVKLFSRSGQDWTEQFPGIVGAISRLPLRSAWLDGEVVALEPDGRSSFQRLQRALSEGHEEDLIYYVFDLLHLDGYDLMPAALEARKGALATLLDRRGGALRYTDHVVGEGASFHREACRLHLEGMISKRKDAPYRPGRSSDWLKVKCLQRQEFVIAGYTDPSGSRSGLGALLLGVHENGRLRYVGKVGTGFTEATLKDLTKRLRALEQRDSPFGARIPGLPLRGIHWVRPTLVAEIAFTEWTSDGLLRHPSFQGLREDKSASEVVRERPMSAKTPVAGPQGSRGSGGPTGSPVEVAGVRLTNPGRVLYPELGLTKLDLARYYESVAERFLRYAAKRPLMILRCPEGHTKECFHQKHMNKTVPKTVKSVAIPEEDGKTTQHLMVDDSAGLIGLVQMGALEIHAWGARDLDIEHPDLMIFDLDPDTGLSWSRITEAARLVRDRLSDLGLRSWVKTTGGKGLHVCVPLSRRQDWATVKNFSHAVADWLVSEATNRYTSNMSKAGRKGKIFIDYLRNGRGATAVAAYSTRARPGARVSLPIDWDELDDVRGDTFTMEMAVERVAGADPWEEFWTTRQSLTTRILEKLRVGPN